MRACARVALGTDSFLSHRQKSLNRSGASSVYLTVCWMFCGRAKPIHNILYDRKVK
jgi:hypothetical protein